MSVDFGEKTLYDLVLPGTHDSGSYIVDLGSSGCCGITPENAWRSIAALPLRPFLRTPLVDFSRTQHLNIYEQLKAGSRFLDFRVSKLASRSDKRFWLIHGQVASVPLEDALEQMNRYHDECNTKTPIVTVVRRLPWKDGKLLFSEQDNADLAQLLQNKLKHAIYRGTALELRNIPYRELPPHIIAGLPSLSGEGLSDPSWGSDIWIDTYDQQLKVAGNTNQVTKAKKRTERDNLFVLAWTVTPQPSDILKRILSCGLIRTPSLETEARKMNSLFDGFATVNEVDIRSNVNVIFFDFLERHDADRVFALNAPPA